MPDKSKWKIFKEDILGIRVKAPTKNDGIPIETPGLVDYLTDIENKGDSNVIVDMSEIDSLRTISDQREYQYKVFDDMERDSIISAALELYADDATQYNRDGDIIWVDSDNKDIAKWGNRLIDILDLNKNAWNHIYGLCLYGDLYLELFFDTDKDYFDFKKGIDSKNIFNDGFTDLKKVKKGSVLNETIEVVDNPCEIFDLQIHNKTIGFLKVPTDMSKDESKSNNFRSIIINANDTNFKTLYDPRKFVHISLSNDVRRFPEKVAISFTKNSDTTNEVETINKVFKVKKGKSILYNIYKIYQEVKLMEDSILLNRITRSSIIRLLQVEVGDMTKSQVNNLLKRLKQMMEQRNMIDKDTGRFKSQASPGPIDNIIYTPTRNGKGQISMSNVGGDVDVKSIADLDYYSNKLFGGLKIPQQFLGFTDDAAGFSGGTSLTKLDSRYARTIKRIQNAYIQGITDLLNLFAVDKGQEDYVNNFKVRMVSPATVEENERDETMSNRIDLIANFLNLITEDYSEETKKKVLEYFIDYYISDNELSELLKEDKGVPDEEPMEDESSEDLEGPSGPGFSPQSPPDAGPPPSTEGNEGFDEAGFDSDMEEFDTSEDFGSDEEFGNFEDAF